MSSCCCAANSCEERRDSLPIDPSVKVSSESLTILPGPKKNWWYWFRFAFFMASPFLARQVGIIVGRRILTRAFAK